MIKILKNILNSYTDEELEQLDLWVNSDSKISNIIIDEWNIDLITKDMKIDINIEK